MSLESFRLKNIIILILILLNVCLLFPLSSRFLAAQSARQQMTTQLVALFAADGIALDTAAISDKTPPTSQTPERNPEQERALATAILGKSLISSDHNGSIHTYDSDTGAARFHANGTFAISAGRLIPEDPESFSRAFCKDFGYDSITVALEGGSGTVTGVQQFNNYPVIRCTISLSFDAGKLITVEGTHLPSAPANSTDTPGESPLSAVAALNAFLAARRQSGAVVSAVTGMYLCYELQGTTAVPTFLSPCWCITTDTSTFYVNCITGAVSQK